MPIRHMFPCLADTGPSVICSPSWQTRGSRAYLFKGNQYALIDYGPDGRLISTGLITNALPSLKGTIFESGIDAAFASHNDNEGLHIQRKFLCTHQLSYPISPRKFLCTHQLSYPISPDSVGSVKEILLERPSLHGFLPRKNYSLIFPVYKDRLHFSDEEDGDLENGEIYVPVYPSDHSDSMDQQDK